MAKHNDSDATLPRLDTGFEPPGACQELLLTILYHPDVSRIGERSPLQQAMGAWTLGRHTPEFDRGVGVARPLGDRHISRAAVSISLGETSVELRRAEHSCRCRVAGSELQGECRLGFTQLEAGVPILLAHSVVVLLSLSPRREITAAPDCGLLGSSAAMCELRRQVGRVASADLDVLLRGESGTGKEVVAGAIHRASPRSRQPMIRVNVAAIPGSLAAAALFGAARGAFTGADRARAGYFQQAAGGTLFLDEIGDAPEEVQPQLLRALEQREVQPVGGDIQRVDLRVLSATDAQLDGETASFKSALRHRLGALEIYLPPLREHREDIGELLHHYLGAALAQLGRSEALPDEGSPPREIATAAVLFYQAACYGWPGNVRQLINVCNQLAVASEESLLIPPSVATLFAAAGTGKAGAVAAADANANRPALEEQPASAFRAMRDVSDEELDRVMYDSYYEVAGVAQKLNVSRQSLYRRMASSGVYRTASELTEPEVLDAVRECGGDTLAASRLLRVSASGLRSRLRNSATLPGNAENQRLQRTGR